MLFLILFSTPCMHSLRKLAKDMSMCALSMLAALSFSFELQIAHPSCYLIKNGKVPYFLDWVVQTAWLLQCKLVVQTVSQRKVCSREYFSMLVDNFVEFLEIFEIKGKMNFFEHIPVDVLTMT